MIGRKDFIILVLVGFFLAVTLYPRTTSSQSSIASAGGYDPWIDYNDDGKIDYLDLYMLAKAYGTSGTPINKTALLLELQYKVDSLNASLLDLEGRVDALEAPGSVTNIKLDDNAIPFDTITSKTYYDTNSVAWVDMPAYMIPIPPYMRYMRVSVTVERPSHLWIMFSTEVYNDAGAEVYVRALVNDVVASPEEFDLTHESTWDSCACNFYYYANAAGTYTVKIQWCVGFYSTGYVSARSLAVIALPA